MSMTATAIIEVASPGAATALLVALKLKRPQQRGCDCNVTNGTAPWCPKHGSQRCKRGLHANNGHGVCSACHVRLKCYCGSSHKPCALHLNPSEAFEGRGYGAAASDPSDEKIERELRILANAYVKGLGISILETYTERVLAGATVQDCLRADFKQFGDTLDGLKESLGSLREQFPADTEADTTVESVRRMNEEWAKRSKLTVGDRAAELRAQAREAEREKHARIKKDNPLRQRRPVRVIERPDVPVFKFKFEFPISGQTILILCRTNAGVIQAALDTPAGQTFAIVGGGEVIEKFADAAEALMSGRSAAWHADLGAFKTWADACDYADNDADGGDIRTLVNLCRDYGTEEIRRIAQSSVSEAKADRVISTAHKAKGREWPSVRIADDFTPQRRAPGERHQPHRADARVRRSHPSYPLPRPHGPRLGA